MPNHVTNEIKAAPHVLAALNGPQSIVDFNAIIPRPKCFNHEPTAMIVDLAKINMGVDRLDKEGNFRDATAVLHFSNVMRMLTEGPFLKDMADEDLESFFGCCRAVKETGYAYWLEWCVDKWGTKWNAYDAEQIDANTVRFQTAWSPPLPVLAELAKRFPTEEIKFRWAGEDFGCNIGRLAIQGETIEGGRLPDDTRESHALAAELLGTKCRTLGEDGRYQRTEE